MKITSLIILFFILLYFNPSLADDGIEKRIRKVVSKVYVISIGFNGAKLNIDSTIKTIGYANCPTCVSDANIFANYFTKLSKNKWVDSSINYTIKDGLDINSFYSVFADIQKKITPNDAFVFYYSSGNWGLQQNAFTGNEESFYTINNKLTNKSNINKYAFTLQLLKQLTDRLPSANQLFIFDTGLGSVIQKDFYNNFFSSNVLEASFTRKKRIIICPENFSSESVDVADNIKKGDLVRIITSMPDSFNILNLFDSMQHDNGLTYKKMMQQFWKQQECCNTSLKILRETEYLNMLTVVQPKLTSGKRSVSIVSLKPTVDSNFQNRKKKAIIIATQKYSAPMWDDAKLYTPIDDCKDIASVLKTKYGYDTTLLINPTKSEIQKVIDDIVYREVANPYNQYVIYFAGHGFWAQRGTVGYGYIVPSDAHQIKDLKFIATSELQSYIDYETLFNNLRQLNKVVLITDVCFGGTSFNSILQSNVSVNPKSERTKVLNPYKKILASGVTEVDDFVRLMDGSISKHSPFAQAILNVLEKQKTSISFESLFSLLKDAVPSSANPKPPTPVSRDFGSITEPNEFIF